MEHRIDIFSGHFGSGKTEVALNFAIKQREAGKKVTIVDFDIVNPYFRTNDARGCLEEKGIQVIANAYASTNLDMPTVPLNILSVFDNKDTAVIFDVGGDDDGALALGQYKRYFDAQGYKMHFVVNTKRPLTRTAEELIEIAERIETASKLRFTDIYNNTNLSAQTDGNTLFSDYAEIEKLSRKMGIDIEKNCGLRSVLRDVPYDLKKTKFEMEIYLRKPWEL